MSKEIYLVFDKNYHFKKTKSNLFCPIFCKHKLRFIFNKLHENKTALLPEAQRLTRQNPCAFSYFAVYPGEKKPPPRLTLPLSFP